MTTADAVPTEQRTGWLYEVPLGFREDMRVPARVFADSELLSEITRDRSLAQLVNVTTLPGITYAALGMPDMHEGYGFPVGGVAATVLPDGVISPGGIGFDINCGVRLLSTTAEIGELSGTQLTNLVHGISRSVPTGYGRGGKLALDRQELDAVLNEGCSYLVRSRGFGTEEDLPFMESGGCFPGADSSHVSERAKTRAHDQLGTLGGGNHFVEVQVVDRVFDDAAAQALGLFTGQITVLIHTGSRGMGHQVCTDFVRVMDHMMSPRGIQVPDRQLACAPFSSTEGQSYFAAMASAANFAWCNRQVITQRVRDAFERTIGGPVPRIVYDVAHNIAKLEPREGVEGGGMLCVHRKGATRSFGPSNPETPVAYRQVGQPVFIPGSMGTHSFVLVGSDASQGLSLSSACHGAGRRMSRSTAKSQVSGSELRKELEARGIVVRCPSNTELAEEAPLAYKDVKRVVDVVHEANLARRVARLRPLGVVKG